MLEDEATMFEELDLIEKINQDDSGKLQNIVEGKDEGGEPKNVAEGQEVWEEETSMVAVATTSMAAAEETYMVAAETTSMVVVIATSMSATSIVTTRAAYAMTFIVIVETTLTIAEEALKPYGFYSKSCSVNASIVAGVEEHLTQLSSQMKGK